MKSNTLHLLGLALTSVAMAQAPPRAALAANWHIPFSTDAHGTAWAAGHDYKVAVDDGATFYPRVAEPEHLPVRWRTLGLAVGDRPVVGVMASAAAAIAGYRVQLDRGGFVEIYDARPEGVEQSFLVLRPAGDLNGDLVVVGELSGALRADPMAAAHGALPLRDPSGQVRATYGAAIAFDAAGQRVEVTTAHAEGRVELRVPAAWLAGAAWPITIDPLLARQTLPGSAIGAAERPQVTRAAAAGRLFVAESRPSAGSDWDLIVRAYNDDWTPLGVVFSDLSGVSHERSSLAYSAQANKLVVALGGETAFNDSVRVYLHQAGNLLLNSGVAIDVPRPAGSHDTEPSLGGSATDYCYLAFRRDQSAIPSNTAQSRILGLRIDAQANALAAAQVLHSIGGANYDAERPSVSEYSESSGWVVVWQEYQHDNVGDDWDVVGERIAADGTPASGRVLAQGTQSWLHKLTPHVAGSGSRFAVTWVARTNDGTKITAQNGTGVYVQTVSWSSLSPAVPGVVHQVDAIALPDLLLGTGTRRMSFDWTTDSHWAVTWDRLDLGELRIARFGYDARLAETAVLAGQLPAGSYAWPSLAFDSQTRSFLAVYASSGVAFGDPAYATRLAHGAAAVIAYGGGCAGSIVASNSSAGLPYAGSELFGLRLVGGRPFALTVLIAATAPAAFPLPSGHAGCNLLVDPALPLLVLPPLAADDGGGAQLGLPLPSGLRGDVYCQFVQLDGELWSSSGLLARIR